MPHNTYANKYIEVSDELKAMFDKIKQEGYITPEKFPKDVDTFMNMRTVMERDMWNNIGMYAFVSKEWVKPLSEWIGKRRVLEVMAGVGWLARALREYGTSIIATDDYSWYNKENWPSITKVLKMDAVEAIVKYAKKVDIIIMSWPYMNDTAYKVIKAMNKENPQAIMIYIGEGGGGCTADYMFFEHYDEIEDPDFDEINQKYRAWEGIHDYLSHGRYKP